MIRWVRDSLPRRRPFLGFSVSSMRRTVFFLVQDRSEERESEEREEEVVVVWFCALSLVSACLLLL